MQPNETLPAILFHGSRYKQNELQPGYNHSRKIVKWDGVENNTFLYATSVHKTAIELGFASSLEKLFDITFFRVQNKEIIIECATALKLKDLSQVPVYIYRIKCNAEDHWEKNDNKSNGLTTEYKTHSTIKDILSCDRLDVAEWLKGYRVMLRHSKDAPTVALESLEAKPVFSW